MASERNDGGPAYPSKISLGVDGYGQEVFGIQPGMTLRDWFAGQALALLAGRSWDHLAPTHNLHEVWAAEAYRISDAMLAELSK